MKKDNSVKELFLYLIKRSSIKAKKQTRSKSALSSLCCFKHGSIYCDSKKLYIWENYIMNQYEGYFNLKGSRSEKYILTEVCEEKYQILGEVSL